MGESVFTAPRFVDDEAARAHLEAIRWPSGPVCPHCGGADRQSRLKGKSCRPGLLFCGHCRRQYTVTVGTVFEKSRVPLHKWVLATHLFCASKKGISAHELHRILGVTYKTAWFMAHRIREAMQPEDPEPLGGRGSVVEADETFWGTSTDKPKRARGYAHKMKIVSMVERRGRARSYHVTDIRATTIASVLSSNISPHTRLMTDEASMYTKVGRRFASHDVVNHGSREYVRGVAHTNTIESFFSIVKRSLMGTYHQCAEKHLQRYVTEFDFRHNHRTKLGFNDEQRCEALLRGISGKRLMYQRLIDLQVGEP